MRGPPRYARRVATADAGITVDELRQLLGGVFVHEPYPRSVVGWPRPAVEAADVAAERAMAAEQRHHPVPVEPNGRNGGAPAIRRIRRSNEVPRSDHRADP